MNGYDLSGFQLPGVQGMQGFGGNFIGAGGPPIADFGAMASMGGAAGGMGGGVPGMGPMGIAQGVMSGLQTIGGLWNAFQQQKLAKKSFQFQKDFSRTNLTNQTQSYNTQMRDRIDSRAFVQGMSPEQANAYYNTNSLKLPPNMRARG